MEKRKGDRFERYMKKVSSIHVDITFSIDFNAMFVVGCNF